MTIQDNEPEIQVGKSGKLPSGQDPDVPVAFASVLDGTPSAAVPGYATSASESAAVPGYEPSATPVVAASTTTASSTTAKPPAFTGTTTTPPPAPPMGAGNGAIPPGAPPGGQWVIATYTGNSTWGIIAGTGCVLFWCCAVVLAPCALFGLCCPCDEKRAYMSPNGVIYDEHGRAIGDSRRNKYKIISKA